MNRASFAVFILMSLGSLFVFSPAVALAQSQDADLRATIMQSLLADPRTANLPPAELSALVDVLVEKTVGMHMSARDIAWRPQQQSSLAPVDNMVKPQGSQCETFTWACTTATAFGFENPNDVTRYSPWLLFLASAFAIFIIAELRKHHGFEEVPKSL